MDVGPFDLRAVPFGGRVVDDHQQPLGQRQGPQHEQQKVAWQPIRSCVQGGQEVIIVLEVVADSDARSQVVTVRRPRAKRMPTSSTGSRQRLRACNPAANHSLHSDHSLGHCQRHFAFAILGSPITCVVENAIVMEEPFSLQDQF